MNKIKFYIFVMVIMLSTSFLFANWNLVAPSDIIYKVQSIDCPDSNNCFALIDHPSTPVLYKSTDQGKSWFLIYENDIKRYPALVTGVSPDAKNYFFIEDTYLNLWKSNDSGYTFQLIQIGTGFVELSNLSMWDSLIGFVTDEYSYYTTTDGWETFERYPKLSTEQVYYSPIFMDSNTVVMTYVANIRWNDSKGFAFVKYHLNENKWDTVSYFGRDSNNWIDAVKNLYFVNDTLGFGCGSRNDSTHDGNYFDIIYKTNNGGQSWELIHKEFKYPQIGFYNNISFADENNGIAVGFYGKIAMTNDGGDNWVYEPTPNAMDNARKMLVCWAGRTPLIGTWDAGIFRYEGDFFMFPPDTTDVEEISQNPKINIRQTQEKILISIEDALHRKYKLQICDIMGNVAAEHELSSGAGTLYVPYDVSALSTGAYLYMISCDGVVVKTGKVILIGN
ncbi:MAG: hypothetical protein V1779_09480 [bacterium]